MNRDTGGPAFPSETAHPFSHGMSLRDYFAARALPALIERGGTYGNEAYIYNELSRQAYAVADAMLAEKWIGRRARGTNE